jgi:hypothetical protein
MHTEKELIEATGSQRKCAPAGACANSVLGSNEMTKYLRLRWRLARSANAGLNGNFNRLCWRYREEHIH